MTKIYWIIFTLLILTNQIQAATCSKHRISYNPNANTLERRITIGDYMIKRSKHNTLTIKQVGKLVYSDCDLDKEVQQETQFDDAIISWDIRFKDDEPNKLFPSLPVAGSDITGDGIANLVIYYTYQSATCCESLVVFELGKKFRKIAKVQGGTWKIAFNDVNGDNIPDIMIHDDFYRNWYIDYTHGGYGYTRPRLILGWNGKDYVLRPDLMRKAPPSMTELTDEAKRISMNKAWTEKHEHFRYVPFELIERSMALMYSGNEALGWQFARMAWSNKVPIDEAFLTEWREQMAKNPVWQAIIHNQTISASAINNQ